jgi:chemosensory pili system protein ChpC
VSDGNPTGIRGQWRGAAEEIYCLIVPLADDRLILPRSCVTEVINYQAPDPDGGSAVLVPRHRSPGAGVVCLSFRSKQPAVKALPRTSGRTRIVVMQGITGQTGGHFAVLTQGFPQLVRLGRARWSSPDRLAQLW